MLWAGASAALAVTALACSASAAHGAYPGRNGLIVFAESASGRGGTGWDWIRTVRADGTGLRTLSGLFGGDYADFQPAWSPDGKRIAFVRSTGGTLGPDTKGTEIYVMNADGRNKRRLTRNKLFDGSPTWSPDGRRILFSRGLLDVDRRHRPYADLWVMNADGTRQRRLARTTVVELDPVWSPRGGRIAFLAAPPKKVRSVLGGYTLVPQRTLWTAAADGTRRRSTGITTGSFSRPDWSPDGTRIAFATRLQLRTVAPDGTGARSLGHGDDPAWSPDGSSLVVSDWQGDFAGIRVVSLGGTSVLLTTNPAAGTETIVEQYDPDWQPLPG